MQTPLTVKTRLTMPMFIAGLVLAGGFVAIAVTVNWAAAGSNARITQATTAGTAALAPAPVTNNVAGSLPAFTLDLDGATAYTVPQVDARWINPKELDRIDAGISPFVWLNSWWDCRFITDDYAYLPFNLASADQATGQDAIDIERWNELTFRQQQNVKGACDR